ncbi:helix-turn-helix transcriptional regulator [Kitasatospora sp. GP82]|uniref:telomere-associated protein Tap n=1 Tax=Kitasatospora sp. GP82 TaxID=3035089 RepID=UPI0024733A75|nr:helix-turn-helix transcriptional regulator [Kitasatospora sp. GP82]MDH6130082.1 DNA-binding XRE family transcriptional regulator [Kitasatospora sp. GP82]
MTEGMDPIAALLAEVDEEELPPPAERKRLRRAAKLTRAKMAQAVRVRDETIWAWETGRSEPRPPQRGEYARLLRGLAERFPAPQTVPAPVPDPVVPEAFAAAPLPEQSAPAVQMVMLDQNPDGSLLMAAPAPCVQCGQPSVYRAQGMPMHLGGFCRPASPVAAPAATGGPSSAVPAVQPAAQPAPAASPAAPAAAPRQAAASAGGPVAAPRRASSSRPAASSRARKAPAKKPAAAAESVPDWQLAAAAKFPAGPLAVLDVAPDGKALVAYLADGTVAATAPAGRMLVDIVEWALETRLGSPRLHRFGMDSDPLVVLTDAALAEFGLPALGTDEKTQFVPRLGRLPKTHKAVKQVEKAGWQLTQRGLGKWARIYRTPEGGKRVCVQLCIPAWGALSAKDHLDIPETLFADPQALAVLLGTYAKRVIAPCGGAPVCGLELMTALRPPTKPVRTESGWASALVDGSLHEAVDPAPCEVPDLHPLAAGRGEGPEHVMAEESWDWTRPLDLLDDAERILAWAVGLDTNTAFLAAAGRLVVGLSKPVHELNPAFDKRIPGAWLVDLSGLDLDPRLPSPFTPTGERPTGPGWYATPTVAYAAELGHDVRPLEGWLRHESGPYLDPWHNRLRGAYMDTMANLGVTAELADGDVHQFLDAMARLKQGDPGELAVLHAVKSTAKAGIGKLREKPRGMGYKMGERWSALDRPTWRPDIRAAVISASRINMHRKMRNLAAATGRYPLAVATDCVVYPAAGPSPLDVLPYGPDGKPATILGESGKPITGLPRLGVSPGHVKHEGTKPLAEVLALMADGVNPGRHVKGNAVADDQ